MTPADKPNIDRLLQLGLSGMGRGPWRSSATSPTFDQLGFRRPALALMIEREAEHRDHKKLSRPSAPGPSCASAPDVQGRPTAAQGRGNRPGRTA